jgi:hypothetical protein
VRGEQIQLLCQALLVTLCVLTLAVSGLLIYLLMLCGQVRRYVRQSLRRPQIERDRDGRRIQERV